MFLSFLELNNFRNIPSQGINFARGITVLWGENGGGKTNILESAYVLSYLRPLRRGGISQLVRHGESESFIRGRVLSEDVETRLGVHLRRGGKITAHRQDEKADSFREYAGGLLSVAFVPDNVRELFGPPQGRRRLLDQSAAMVRPLHVDVLLEFLRCLRHRNRLLFLIRDGRAKESLLDSFDSEFCRLSAELAKRRKSVVSNIRRYFDLFYENIDGTGGTSLQEDIGFDEGALARAREQDIVKGTSTYGPHRDDFTILLNGRDGRFYASQGRKRILSIAFRLSQAMLLRDLTGHKPILLLDDVTSEIDPGRRGRLLKILEDMAFQTVITSTEAEIVRKGFSHEIRALQVQNGAIM